MEQTTLPKTLPVRAVAQHLRVHRTTVYGLIAAGNLHAVRIGRRWEISEDSLIAFATPAVPAATARA